MNLNIHIPNFYIYFHGDSSTGIQSSEWKITGGFDFTSKEELETFKEQLLKTWELVSDTPIGIETEYERLERAAEEYVINFPK